ncbi:MAG: hypothetical protein DRJ05_04515 [Bacteroidetes bacterium]|nr:MAG: hypothetical protein DRJ05_04515 [Bacteroidota bacterium]
MFIFLLLTDRQGFTFCHGFRLPFDKLRAGIENPAKTTFAILFYPSLKAGAIFSPSCPSVQAGIIILLPARINSFRRVCIPQITQIFNDYISALICVICGILIYYLLI